MKSKTLEMMSKLLLDTNPQKLKSLGFCNQDIHIAIKEAAEYLKNKNEDLEEHCIDVISDIVIDLDKLNIGLAKDKLYNLLQKSGNNK